MKDNVQPKQQAFLFATTDTDTQIFRSPEIQSSEESVCELNPHALKEALPSSQTEHEQITTAISGPLFRLCRQIRRIEADQQKALTTDQTRAIYEFYYEEYLRCGKAMGWSSEPSCDVWDSFVTQLKTIMCATGEHPVRAAYRLSRTLPDVPAAANRYEQSPSSKLMLQLCYWLSVMKGGGVYFLSCYDVETYAGVDRTTASKKLRDFCNTTPPVLKRIRTGHKGGPASEYDYLL
jgi:hypothetical protein